VADRAGLQRLPTRLGLGGDRVRQRACVPADQIAHLDRLWGAVRRAGGDPARTGGGGIEQEIRRRPMLGVLGQHPAQQVGDEVSQAMLADQRHVAALVQFPQGDFGVGDPGEG
jgi:hypothetical protein